MADIESQYVTVDVTREYDSLPTVGDLLALLSENYPIHYEIVSVKIDENTIAAYASDVTCNHSDN